MTRLPRGIWALGLTSLLMDASSELVHALLPLFLTVTLGASVATLGALEGVAEAVAQFTKLGSGWLSDRLGRRKGLVVLGYGLAALTKPLFPLADDVGSVFFARGVDRLGKGIRGAPRDALIADITPPGMRGAAYGLRQSMDSVGAVLGPAAAILLMIAWAGDLRAAMWFAVLPAALAVMVLVTGVREPAPREAGATPRGRPPLHWADLREFPARLWGVVALGGLFTLARFSEAFLVLRASQSGLGLAKAPAVLAVMSLTYALSAYPAGRASDRFGGRALLAAGLGALILADLLLAASSGTAIVLAGAAVWGLHMGLTQGVFSRLVADAAPAALRGSAFGAFGLVTGLALLASSAIAGVAWERRGPSSTFLIGAGFAALTLAVLVTDTVFRSRATPRRPDGAAGR
jgi:MFS family permease